MGDMRVVSIFYSHPTLSLKANKYYSQNVELLHFTVEPSALWLTTVHLTFDMKMSL